MVKTSLEDKSIDCTSLEEKAESGKEKHQSKCPQTWQARSKKKKKNKADRKNTINAVLFVQRHESPSHPLLSSSFLSSLEDFIVVSRCRNTEQTGERTKASINLLQGREFSTSWDGKQKKLFWVSFSTGAHQKHTRTNTTDRLGQLFPLCCEERLHINPPDSFAAFPGPQRTRDMS
jgi:hypothetical protein